MNIKEFVEFVTGSCFEYFNWFVEKLTNSNQQESAIKNKEFGFVVLSILIGTFIFRGDPRLELKSFFLAIIIILLCWISFSLWVHLLCRLFKGTGDVNSTLSVCVMNFSFIYVLSNFAFFILSLLPHFKEDILSRYYGYLCVQYILLTGYLPIGLKEVHNFTKSKMIISGIVLPVTFVLLNVALFLSAIYGIDSFGSDVLHLS